LKTTNLNKELLEFYYSRSFNNFSTGMDKITQKKFSTIKDEEFNIIIRKVKNSKYCFTRLKKIILNNNRVVYIPTIRDRLVLDYLKDVLNSKYRIDYKDRDIIINTLKNKLSIQKEFYILRIDIKKFFDSIPHNKLLYKLKRSSLLSKVEYNLIKEILKKIHTGIPQGLPVSNPLAEIYLEEFDMQMKKIDQRLNYYCRYVDDILIFFNGNFSTKEKVQIKEKINILIKSFGLEQNCEKFSEAPTSQNKTIRFEYLGYEFVSKEKTLQTNISTGKSDKFKRKINSCFNAYIKEMKVNRKDNINLLIERLNFLTKNQFLIKKQKAIDLDNSREYYKLHFVTSGFLSSYKQADQINIEQVCREIDDLIMKRTQSLNKYISQRKSRRILFSISMLAAYKNYTVIPVTKFTTKEYIKRIQFINPSINSQFLNSLTFNELEKYYFKYLNLNNL
jgi:Reverse transcriptase (RNA-dependent DNA polymerase)